MLTDTQFEYVKEQDHGSGLCEHCGQVIKIYRYSLNKTLADFLWRMANRASETGNQKVDISTLGMAYSQRTQVTKMRLHGLIARVKNDEGTQEPNHWLITTKGYEWLRGGAIAEKVVVFNNQVIGHDGREVTIKDVTGVTLPATEAMEGEGITEPEAKAYTDLRKPRKGVHLTAVWRGSFGGLIKGQTYQLELKRLQIGQPVVMLKPFSSVYRDIAAFEKEWQIIKQEQKDV